jgi:phage-related protein
MTTSQAHHPRFWRFYKTASGREPVEDFLDSLSDDDAEKVVAAMADVENEGLTVARHLRGEIYEVRANGRDRAYRVLFAKEGRYGQVLLALEAFSKKSQNTPPAKIEVAEARLTDWREQGKKRRTKQAARMR